MRRKKFLIPMIALFFAITSCNDESPINGIQHILGVSSDNDQIVALFRVCSWHNWNYDFIGHPDEMFGPPYIKHSNYSWAYISDGVKFVNPASISCNGVPMKKLEDGQYEFFDGGGNGHLTRINWNVNNILGHTYNVTDANLPKIIFTNIHNDDVIDISRGLNIQYTGNVEEVESILVRIQYNYYVGFSNEHRMFRFEKFFPNNGNIVLTEDDLASFPVSTIDASYPAAGYIELWHKKYIEEEFYGRTIAKVYETSMLIWATFVR